MHELLFFPHSLTEFARAGGGGSGGGGDGGGGIFFLLGYLPMHFLGAWFRKLHKKHPDIFILMQVLGWIVALLYFVLWTFILHFLGFLIGVLGLIGMGAGLYGWFGKLRQSKKTKAALQAAGAQDAAWDENRLVEHAKAVFTQFQQDWSNYNTEGMKAYLTPSYQYHNALMVYALQLAGRRDMVYGPTITQAVVIDVQDAADNSQDMVTIGIEATANDQLLDTQSNQVLFTDSKPFTEFWRFQRSGNTWLLSGIQQATASAWSSNPSLEQFAAQHGFYYSLDWGWLLLPRRGQLFGEGKFGTSDINNHVIGLYNQQLLVQLYTYVPNPASSTKSYLIAQANLPKSYGDIVVRHKKGLHLFGIKGLREVSTEWPDFNKKYQVFATSPEQATSLELLNPKYMEQLEAVPFEVNIEVVDNVVYLYAPENKVVEPAHYATMLRLLQAAFKEMRL